MEAGESGTASGDLPQPESGLGNLELVCRPGCLAGRAAERRSRVRPVASKKWLSQGREGACGVVSIKRSPLAWEELRNEMDNLNLEFHFGQRHPALPGRLRVDFPER